MAKSAAVSVEQPPLIAHNMNRQNMRTVFLCIVLCLAIVMFVRFRRQLARDATSNSDRIGMALVLANGVQRFEQTHGRPPISMEELSLYLSKADEAAHDRKAALRIQDMLLLFEFPLTMSGDVIIIEKAEFIRGTSKPYAITRNGKIVYWDNERWHEVN